jgi:amino-acid N-acetyltransferase
MISAGGLPSKGAAGAGMRLAFRRRIWHEAACLKAPGGAQKARPSGRIQRMKVRAAQTSDAQTICDLVNPYAERGLMLHRSLESVYDSVREFHVVEDDDGRLIGCCAVDVFWSDLAEIKSFAVAPDRRGRGVGGRLMEAAMKDARSLGVRRLFALTYETEFFVRHGFAVIDRRALPDKVWRECIACPKADACDEVAVMLHLDEPPRAEAPRGG